ncbi:alpha/beta hydrolase [Nocardia sp. 2]|uniref:Alpha/beta hydrolase n=1 Tax=Nocardia acididurans TaxID=2802282 RepID=A0ABS1M9D7_9NOCA|nr:alpha/beta hydrolase [Nocardia acididurans]MBL1076650.1 alpha/beta hydrolase [Nocardia acididurans]
MAKIGKWKSDAAKAKAMRIYDSLEELQPVASTGFDVATSYGSTRVRKFGSDPRTPLVLFHPMGGNGLCWYPIIEQLAAERTVYALDTIGAPGRSEQTRPITAAADYAAWIEDALAALGLEQAHLLGYSDGAWRASMAGVHSSRRLASLTLVEPGAGIVKPSWRLLLRMIRVGVNPTPEKLRRFSAWFMPGVELSEVEIEGSLAALGYRPRTPWPAPLEDAELQSITAPTLVVYGSESVLLKDAETARARVRLIPGAEFELVPGGGHGLLFQDSHKGVVLARVFDFIAQHDQAELAH